MTTTIKKGFVARYSLHSCSLWIEDTMIGVYPTKEKALVAIKSEQRKEMTRAKRECPIYIFTNDIECDTYYIYDNTKWDILERFEEDWAESVTVAVIGEWIYDNKYFEPNRKA